LALEPIVSADALKLEPSAVGKLET
jgi:hypothetical protein